LATGLATLAALAVMLWPTKDWHLEPERLSAFGLTLLAWIVASLPEDESSVHDTELFARFQAVITPSEVNWLRRHDFGGSFSTSRLQPIFDIDGDWEGAAFTFDDSVLHPQFESLLADLVDFARLVALNTWLVGANRQTAVPEGDSIEMHPHVRERVVRLNTASASLATSIDAFVLKARKRLS
jgi:hypothetical protein